LGTIEALACDQADMRKYAVISSTSSDELLDLFEFHVSRNQVEIKDLTQTVSTKPVDAVAAFRATQALPGTMAQDDPPPGTPLAPSPGFGFFDGAPGAPTVPPTYVPAAIEKVATQAKPIEKSAGPLAQVEAATIRVSISKVDQLINLVGELVITQAMLAQNSRALEAGQFPKLMAGLADLDRNTRDLQESVMSIRMIPMSVVFNRFPRMLRDLANKLGKKVELVTQGEATELDKGLVEKITDPLTHLVRNSCDHGVEMPADRIANGKPEVGTITLAASHQGGSIVTATYESMAAFMKDNGLLKEAYVLRRAPAGTPS
jgi:two-component system chemotaxis sensor kinase CheA